MSEPPPSIIKKSALADILITKELSQRRSRVPNYEAEARALHGIAQTFGASPRAILQKLSDISLSLCHADSAGISILETDGPEPLFRWHATSGGFAPFLRGTMPRDASPCGVVREQNQALLFDRAERYFSAIVSLEPRPYEILLTPWEVNGAFAGTLWVVSHTPERHFDAEDLRLLVSLSRFAAAAWTRASSEEQLRLTAEQNRFYVVLGDALQVQHYPGDVQADAAQLLGKHLAADRVRFSEISHDGEREIVHTEYREAGRPSTDGMRPFYHYGERQIKELRAGRTVVVSTPAERDAAAHQAAAYVRCPILWQGRLVALVSVEQIAPRFWTASEIELIRCSAQRVWEAVERCRSEGASRLSDERFQLAVRATNDAIWDWDLKTNGTWWSDGIRSYGYAERDVGTDANWWYEHIHPDDRDRVVTGIHAAIDSGKSHWRDEYRFQRADGTYADILDRGYVIRDTDGQTLRMIGALQDLTERKLREEQFRKSEDLYRGLAQELEHRVVERTRELWHSKERLSALANELNLTEQRERKRLATELHDHLQQILVLSKLKLAQGKRLAEPIPACAALIAETDEILGEALRYTRTLVTELSPPVLREHGLRAGLEWLADYMKKHDMVITVEVPETEIPLPEEHAILLFQSVRELLINAWKYAKTGAAIVRLEKRDCELRIEVRDEGVGCTAVGADANMSSKFGLFSIRERMKALGGDLDWRSESGRGTTATLIVPLVDHDPTLGPSKLIS